MEVYGLSDRLDNTAIAAGTFDGVHLGHRAVISAMLEEAARRDLLPVVQTFDGLPARAFGRDVRCITDTGEKLRLLESAGASGALLIDFDREFAAMPPEEFVRLLTERFGARLIVVGENYTFGSHAAGTPGLLREMAREYDFEVVTLPPVRMGELTVSSTCIREAVATGDMPLAAELLGRRFSITGSVEQGYRLGRKLGVPTMNLAYSAEQLLPKPGVYATTTMGRMSVTNVGDNPTMGRRAVTVETHLLDFDEQAYGRTVTVEFLEWLRPEHKFADAQELAAQIKRDIDTRRSMGE